MMRENNVRRRSKAGTVKSVIGPLPRTLTPPLVAVLNASMKRERYSSRHPNKNPGDYFLMVTVPSRAALCGTVDAARTVTFAASRCRQSPGAMVAV